MGTQTAADKGIATSSRHPLHGR